MYGIMCYRWFLLGGVYTCRLSITNCTYSAWKCGWLSFANSWRRKVAGMHMSCIKSKPCINARKWWVIRMLHPACALASCLWNYIWSNKARDWAKGFDVIRWALIWFKYFVQVLQRKTEEAATAMRRLKELQEARKSSRETAPNGIGCYLFYCCTFCSVSNADLLLYCIILNINYSMFLIFANLCWYRSITSYWPFFTGTSRFYLPIVCICCGREWKLVHVLFMHKLLCMHATHSRL